MFLSDYSPPHSAHIHNITVFFCIELMIFLIVKQFNPFVISSYVYSSVIFFVVTMGIAVNILSFNTNLNLYYYNFNDIQNCPI